MRIYVTAGAIAFAASVLPVNASPSHGMKALPDDNVIAQMVCIDPVTKLPVTRSDTAACSSTINEPDEKGVADGVLDLVSESTEGLSVEGKADGSDQVDLQDRLRKYQSTGEGSTPNGGRYGVVDPQSGELISGAAAEKARQDQSRADADSSFQRNVIEMMESAGDVSQLRVETSESGAKSVNLQGRFRIPLVVTIGSSHKAAVSHGLSAEPE